MSSHSAVRARIWRTLQLATQQEIAPHEAAGSCLLRYGCFPDQLHPVGEYQPVIPICCGQIMHGHGAARRRCPVCHSTIVPTYCRRLERTPDGWRVVWSVDGLPIWHDADHRACVTLHPRHPYANSAGYQRLARFLIAEELGYLPRSDEHTHHTNGNLTDDRVDNLELVAVEYHGRLHCAPRGELCRNPTRAQIDRGLPPGEVWTGSNRRVHSSRVGQVEYLQALKAALGV